MPLSTLDNLHCIYTIDYFVNICLFQGILQNTTGGLENLGNTCFLNATVQALTHLNSVLKYFEFDYINKHLTKCASEARKTCTICIFQQTLSQSLQSAVMSPIQLVRHLSFVCPRMILGYQQDAPEYFRYAYFVVSIKSPGCLTISKV